MRILVTGATGYIGGRLVPRLLEAGHDVRCLTRAPVNLALQAWRRRVEVIEGDVLDIASVKEAAAGCDAAYYLVPSAIGDPDFEEIDRAAALTFTEAAADAGLDRIVYLGELGDPGRDSSRNLASRHEVGRILAGGTTPVTELRAGMIIGSGSKAFDMLRALTDVSPLLPAPKWITSPCQPIGVRDVLDVLVESLEHDGNRILDLGGPDVITFRELMHIYADEAGLRRRRFVRFPFLSPRVSSWWVGLITPLPSKTARPVIESIRSGAVVRAPERRVGDTTPRAAIQRALRRLPTGVTTRWSDAGGRPTVPGPTDPAWNGSTVYLDRQVIPTEAAGDQLYWAFSRIGGSTGYYWLDWAWRIRGFLDQLVGGVGLRRGRRHPTDVRPGESIDFWRVEFVEPGRSLRLRAEMKLPGDAWVQWDVTETDSGADLVQSAWFRPRGLWGRIYWFSMLPIHKMVFPNMACRIAATAEERHFASG